MLSTDDFLRKPFIIKSELTILKDVTKNMFLQKHSKFSNFEDIHRKILY